MKRYRLLKDSIAGKLMFFVTVCCALLVLGMGLGLFIKAWPILAIKPLAEILFSEIWHPLKGEFGMFPFITGTLWVTGIAIIIATPISLLTAIYLSEYAPKRMLEFSRPFIDLLAGIPSVIYGVWGILIIVPLVKNHIAPLFGYISSGYSVLSAGIVLSIMIFPVIIHITVEVFQTVPRELREASLALGATRWQTVKHVLLRKALPGIAEANVLGFSRAFGETMAVLMVAGNMVKTPSSVFDAGYPLPALIANNYGEMLSIPLYDSALLLAALVLFIVVIFFNVLSRYILHRINLRIN
ncbi:MAG TPA: phosphate ABC transporter permease subunit PstC [Spirochaetota bacterium]|nr:phosphate ABC transporter permease subunit PstC [Spirochaetota bacterium]HOD13373.1 phosphate ABC transporter permease subunit PstC [Spirochaetota bacterium]HPG50536.1 phosphate ABC transporter permease subunit PstC [Spirochaetota bacterium]HPN13342.1 phosphate ABC transporter permease subunit PstC [Spirochaetota bacterium]